MNVAMSHVTPETIHGQGSTEIVLRRRNRWRAALALVAFLAIWVLGGGFAALMLIAVGNDQPLFFAVWLLLWCVGGGVAFLGLLWKTFASESVIIRSDSLTLVRRLLLLRFPVVVPAKRIRALGWVADDPHRSVTVNGRRVPQTAIEISSGDGSFRFARGIGKAEADNAIATMKQRLVVSWKRRP